MGKLEMISALITGTLFRDPEQREAKSGKLFTKACLRVTTGETSQFVNLIAFQDSVQAELLTLHEGDALAAQGALKCDLYETADGAKKLSLNLTISQILPLRQPKERKAKAGPQPASRLDRSASRAERCAGVWTGQDDGPDDEIPF
jgi:single-stranded DNA-binding protein